MTLPPWRAHPLAAVLDALTDGVTVQDRDGRLVYANDMAARLIGFASAEALLQTPVDQVVAAFEMFDETGQPFSVTRLPGRLALRGVQPRAVTLRFREKRTGRERWAVVEARPLHGADGQVERVVNTFRDVTERKQAEVSGAETAQRLHGIITSAMDAIISINEAQNIVVFNPAAERLFRCSAGEALGQPLDRFLPAPFRDAHRRHIREFGRTGVTSRSMTSPGELTARRADGSEFPIEATISYVDAGGQKLYTVILRDITERKQLERERERLLARERDARAAAEKANSLKLQFLAMISHELRTPLASIKGFASSLLADDVTFDSATQRNFLRIIDEESDKLANLVEQLLDLSRLQAGNLSIQTQPDSLDAILASALPTLEMLAPDHRLVVDIPPDLPPVMADRQRIVQVVANLVGNSARYAPAGTEIRITGRACQPGVCVDVSDEGPGIAPEDRELVFEAFRQVARAGQPASKGAGLGLAICKGLIEAHGGDIQVRDAPGAGAVIAFTLPAASA